MIEIVKAKSSHIPHIAVNMREADKAEVWASHKHSTAEALTASFAASTVAFTGLVDGVPAAMWGVGGTGSFLQLIGSPWLLGTPDAVKNARFFLKVNRLHIQYFQQLYPRLQNYVHMGNTTSIKWLKWCGFTVEKEPVEFGALNEKFYFFHKG